MIKSIALAVAAFCITMMMPTNSEAQIINNADPSCPQQCGPCVCYCPMVKYVPKYHCEKKCYDEPYQVAKKCVRYVPEYYTKTFCRQVPQCYYTYETKCRKRYVTETKCTYIPQRYIVKKCIDCPAPAPCEPACVDDFGPNNGRVISANNCRGGACRAY